MFYKKKQSLLWLALLLAWMLLVAACSSAPQAPVEETPTISEPKQNTPNTPANPSTGVYGLNSYEFKPASSINFGSGFYTMKEEFLGVGNCLAFGTGFKTLADVLEYEPSAIKIDFSTSIANNRKELLDKLDVSLGLKATFGIVTVDGKGKYASDKSVNENKLYLVTKGKVTGTTFGFLTLGEDRVHLRGYNKADPNKSTGFAKMYLEEYDSFLERCGDKFVSSITIGGEFYLVIEIDTYSSDHKREISGELKVDVEGIGGGSAELTSVMNKLKSQSNIKIKLFSSGLFPNPNTLLNAEKNPTQTVTDLLNSLKSECLNIQEKTTNEAKELVGNNLEGYTPLAWNGLSTAKFADDDLKQVLQQLSNCSARVGLTDYKVLTSQSAAAKALKDAKNAIQATYVNSRLMILLSNLGSYVNNVNFYIENPSLYTTATATQRSPQKAKNHLDTVVTAIEAKMRRQAALCQLRDYDSCKEVTISYDGKAYNEAALNQLINTTWAQGIPERLNQELPNTCDALHKARGKQNNFSVSSEYTIFYNNDLRRSYRVFCIKTPTKEDSGWLDLGNSPISKNWTNAQTPPTYTEYLQLINLNNSASAYTNNQSKDFNLNNGTASQVSRYDRIHIDPIDLAIVPEVTTYAFNVGGILPKSVEAVKGFNQLAPERAEGDPLKMIPYGSAASCDSRSAMSYVSLENTPLYLDPIMSRSAAWSLLTTSVDTPAHNEYSSPSITFNPVTVNNKKLYGKAFTLSSGALPNKCSILSPKDFRIKLTIPIDSKPIDASLYNKTVSFSADYSLPKDNEYYGIKLKSSPLLCIDQGSDLKLGNCTTQNTYQTWLVSKISDDVYQLAPFDAAAECLTISNNSASGADVKSATCEANINQQWRISPQGGGSYQFRWRQDPNLCLGIVPAENATKAAKGDVVKAVPCTSNDDFNAWKLNLRAKPAELGAHLQLTIKDLYVQEDCDGGSIASVSGHVKLLGGKHGEANPTTSATHDFTAQGIDEGSSFSFSNLASPKDLPYYYDNRQGSNRLGIDIALTENDSGGRKAFTWNVPAFDFKQAIGKADPQGRSVDVQNMAPNSTATGKYQQKYYDSSKGYCDMTLTYEIHKGKPVYK